MTLYFIIFFPFLLTFFFQILVSRSLPTLLLPLVNEQAPPAWLSQLLITLVFLVFLLIFFQFLKLLAATSKEILTQDVPILLSPSIPALLALSTTSNIQIIICLVLPIFSNFLHLVPNQYWYPTQIFFSFFSFFFKDFTYLIIGYLPSTPKIQTQLAVFAIMWVAEHSIIFIKDTFAGEKQFILLLALNLKPGHHLFLQDPQDHLSVQITIIIAIPSILTSPAGSVQLKQGSKMNVFKLCSCSLFSLELKVKCSHSFETDL